MSSQLLATFLDNERWLRDTLSKTVLFFEYPRCSDIFTQADFVQVFGPLDALGESIAKLESALAQTKTNTDFCDVFTQNLGLITVSAFSSSLFDSVAHDLSLHRDMHCN